MSQINNFYANCGNSINVLTQGNVEPIDRYFFMPLYHHLIKSYLDESVIIERINTLDIPNDIKKIDHMLFQSGKIWEEYVQTKIRKFVTENSHLKYFYMYQDQKKIVPMPNGSVLIKENDKLIAEFDCLLLYCNRHPIIIEIKSSTKKSSGYMMNGTSYSDRMELIKEKEIFSDYDEPFFLKIRASEDSHKIGLTSQFRNHRRIAMNHSPMLTDLKHRLLRARFK